MIVFEPFQLDESLDRAAPYKWGGGSAARFEVNGTKYQVEFSQRDGITYDEVGRDLTTLDVAFRWLDPEMERYSYALKKDSTPRESMTVLATVLAATFEKADKTKPDLITFSAFSDTDGRDAKKRFDLYNRMAIKYGKQKGYTVHTRGRNFILVNDKPVAKAQRRLANDGVLHDEELTYVEFSQCNAYTWAKIFDVKEGKVARINLPHGWFIIDRTSDEIDIMVGGSGGSHQTLDNSSIWRDMMVPTNVQNGTREFEIEEYHAVLADGRVLMCGFTTFYILPHMESVKEIWGNVQI
ncbi:hypothetical protein NVP1081O_083 [Vibrio phage 1.081.O._10N.286.52.C2]|nr:hypothetical protein NVP1081O_083 [Vibrio phage 1.081.O._10N.286.52.C2]